MTSCSSLSRVHRVDFGVIAFGDGIALELAVRGEQAGFGSKTRFEDAEAANLAVMRKLGIDGVDGRLHSVRLDLAGDQYGNIAASVAYKNHLLRVRKEMGELVLDGFGSEFVAGVEDQKILDAADDAPVAAHVDFALIAGMEPAVAEDFGRLLGAIPVA